MRFEPYIAGPKKQTQGAELNFIKNLGTQCERKTEHPERTIALLEGYIAALPHRSVWFHKAHPEKLRHHAQLRLDSLREGE